MKCPHDPACVADYVQFGRHHQHTYLSLAGFTVGDPAYRHGVPVGEVRHLTRRGRDVVEVAVAQPGQVQAARYMASDLDAPGEAS